MVLRATGTPTYHEPLVKLIDWRHRVPLIEGATGEARDAMLAGYRRWRDARLREGGRLAEVHTTFLTLWPEVLDELAPVRVLLVRHPIQVVNAMAEVISLETREAEAGVGPIGLPNFIDELRPHEKLFCHACRVCAVQIEMLSQLAPITLYRLEDVTRQPDLLAEFLHVMTGIEPDRALCEELGARVVNRKVAGDRSPANVYWNRWDETRRALFGELCGDALDPLGYGLPERGAREAGREPDPPPKPRRHERPPRCLRSLWAFHSNPGDDPVLVVGNGRRAAAAADRLKSRPVFLLHSEETPWPSVPDGLTAVAEPDVRLVGARAAFAVADDDEQTALVERVLARIAGDDWEIAWAFPPEVGGEPFDAPADDGGGTIVRYWHGVRTELDLGGGWSVDRIVVRQGRTSIRVKHRNESLDLSWVRDGANEEAGPVRCRDGTLIYPCGVSFDEIRPVLEAIALAASAGHDR